MRIWKALPDGVRAYLEILSSMWLSIAGIAAITWGVALFSVPVGYIVGGFSALLLDRGVDMATTKGGRR